MVGLSLVKTDLSTPLHVRIQDPLNNEKGPFNTTNFTKRNCKVVLSWVEASLRRSWLGLILPAVIVAAQRNLWSLPFLQHRF
jgi:hypothetical protein